MMSDPTTVDRATIDRATGTVVLIIKEDRPWNDPETMHRELRSKVKRYVRYIRSEEFASEYGREPGETLIRLVCSDPPDDQTMEFLGRVRYELGKLGIGFDHRVEWFSDETEGERPLTVEGWEARTRFGRQFEHSGSEPDPESEPEPAAADAEQDPEAEQVSEAEQLPGTSHPDVRAEAADARSAEPETSPADLTPEATETEVKETEARETEARETEARETEASETEAGETEPEASRPDAPPAAESETPAASEASSEPDALDVPAPPEGFQPNEGRRTPEMDPDEADLELDTFEPVPEDTESDEFDPTEGLAPMMGQSKATPDMFADIDHELIEEPGIEAPEGLETGAPEPAPEAEIPGQDGPDTPSSPPIDTAMEPTGAPPGDRPEGPADQEPDAAWPAEEFGDMGPGHEEPGGLEPEDEPREAEIEILAGDHDGEELWEELSAVGDREAAARVATEAEPAEEAPSRTRALGAALGTALAFAVAWGLLAVAAGQAAAPVAVPLGLAVGFRVRLRGAGTSFGFRLIGGLGALLGCALGSLLATVGLLTVSEGLDAPTLLERFTGAQTTLDTLGGFYGLTDLGIYAIAILLSFWLSAARESE